jgi:hypothetical protein
MSAEQRVIDAARRLVAKVQAEEARGTPVHPAGHPNCPWRLSDGGYPAEYAALARALERVPLDGVVRPADAAPAPGGTPGASKREGAPSGP